MRTLLHHIERARAKPHHVRRKIAVVAAGVGTGVIALAWFVFTLSTGAFAIQGTTFAESTGQAGPTSVAASDMTNNSLAGAAAAFPDDTSGPARIQIVDAKASTTQIKQPEATVLPF